MDARHEIAWVALAVASLAALQALSPDAGGSPSAPEWAMLMIGLAVVISTWLVAHRRHRQHH